MKKEMNINLLKMQIETEKITLKRFVDVLIKYDFSDSSTASVYFNDMYFNLIKVGMEQINKSTLSNKKKEKLKRELFWHIGLNDSEESRLAEELEYYKHLIHWARYMLNSLSKESKEKIINDSIRNQELWSKQFDVNSKIYKEIMEKRKK
jgi:hypothetical protein